MYVQLKRPKGILFLSLLFLLTGMSGCGDKDKPAKYHFYFRGDDLQEEWIFHIDDLSKGLANPKVSGITLNDDIYYDLYYYKGIYYDIDRPDKIKKYIQKGNKVVFLDSCVITSMTSIETHSFVDDSTLLVVGLDMAHRNPVYAIIDTKEFNIRKEGNIPIPDDGSYQRTSVGFAAVKEEKLYINYVYHNWQDSVYTTSDSICLVTLDYPLITPRHYSFSHKSSYPPQNGRHQPTMAVNEQGQIFFITNTSEEFNIKEDIPSGILKVDMVKENIAPDFFINISDSLKNCYPVAIWFVSGDIFLIKCERQDLVNSWSDFIEKRIFEYYAVNVATKTLNKLNLPLDKPWYTNNVLVDDSIAYIANNAEDGYTFWLFDPKNNSLQKGLKIDPDVARIFTIALN